VFVPSSRQGKEIAPETFQNNYENMELGSTIRNSDGLRGCYGEFKTLPDYIQYYNKEHDSQISEEEIWEHEQEESHQTLSPSHQCSKPPIYKKTSKHSYSGQKSQSTPDDCYNDSNSSRITREIDDQDITEQNLNVVEESLNDIQRTMRENNSFVNYKDNTQKMVCEKITLQNLIDWQQILQEASYEDMEWASMEYKNELLKLASIISDVLSPE
jgi:hypothetical protein